MTTVNRALKTALVLGLAASLAACAQARRILPFGLGEDNTPQATASEGQRISILSFEQQLSPAAGLAGRDFFLPGPVAANAWPLPGGNAENAIEHVIAAPQFTIGWRRKIGAGSARDRQVMSPVVADAGKIFVMDGESTVTAVDAGSGAGDGPAVAFARSDVRPAVKRRAASRPSACRCPSSPRAAAS